MANATTRRVLATYWRHLRNFRWTAVFLLVIVTANYVLDLIGPLFYKDFFNLLATGSKADQGLISALVKIIIVILAINSTRWLFYRISGVVDAYLLTKVSSSMDQANFASLLEHSYAFFTNSFAGGLTRKIKRYSDAFDTLLETALWNLLPVSIIAVGSLIVLYRRDTLLGLTMTMCIVLVVVANVVFSAWKLKYDIRRAAKDTETTAALTDSIANSVNVKLFTGRPYEMALFGKVRDELKQAALTSWLLAEGSFAVQAALMVIVEFAVMYVAILAWQQGRITLGDFALIQAYMISLFERIWNIGRVMRKIYEAMADAKEMVDILDMPLGVKDKPTAKRLKVTQGAVAFDKVCFNYNRTRKTLDGFDLSIAPGERVALVGPSGAGKSTAVKLLLRFHDVDAGHILIDGQDISRVTQESLRADIAFVPQDPVLFHRNLMDNIRYGLREADEAKVIQASKLAHCHEFIEELPEGYATFVGERGIKLSGGERQRVAIARAMLKNAPILVLDEATSSLDSESEAKIQEALKALMKGRTVIVIAHRLSTIMQMDRIAVVDRGRIVDQGTHQELLARDGLYRTLWNIQAGGFIS